MKVAQVGFCLLVFLLVNQAEAQIKATTDDGKRVALYADGRWKYIEPANPQAEKTTPDYKKIISGKCIKDWPDDFRMRAYCEEKQTEALMKLSKGKPPDILEAQYNQILRKCSSE